MALFYCCLGKGMIAVLLMTVLSGCIGRNTPDLNQELPENWNTSIPAHGHHIATNSWWKAFNDPVLNTLVEDALDNNLDIAQAVEGVKKARALNNAATSPFLPDFSAGLRTAQDAAARDNFLHSSIDMVWELSLYGETANTRQASGAVILSAQAQAQGIRIAVVANVVQNYLRYTYTGQQLALMSSQETIEKRSLKLSALRRIAHIGSDEERIDSLLRMANLQANIIELEQVKAQSSRALSLLTNKTQAQIVRLLHDKVIAIPAVRIEEVPADLLRIRPDILQVEADVLRSAADVGLAKAALYPRLTLSGSILYAYNTNNYQRSNNNPLFFAPAIDIPLWNWGQRLAIKHAKEYELQAALLAYRKTIQDSIIETEDALSALASQNQRVKALRIALEQKKHLSDIQQKLEQLGLSSKYDGLSGQRTILQGESELAEAQFRHASALVTLYKALGGAPLSATNEPFSSDSEGRG